ncbi:MAG: antibiotic biosynthesis monooxygenase [Myxococcota bacterium]|nr:antibiotic biosynthesis monooxygenase [Myxococcota bacterium]
MAVVVFRSRVDEGHREEFDVVAQRMLELARGMPGFLLYKFFSAEDDERVSIIEFETAEHAADWGRQSEHLEAQRAGRDRFYTEYSVQTCEVVRERRFKR